jgi:hypothetical protein
MVPISGLYANIYVIEDSYWNVITIIFITPCTISLLPILINLETCRNNSIPSIYRLILKLVVARKDEAIKKVVIWGYGLHRSSVIFGLAKLRIR